MITVSAATLALVGTIIALASALISGAVVWGEMKSTVATLVAAVGSLTVEVKKLTTDYAKVTTDLEVLKDRTSRQPHL